MGGYHHEKNQRREGGYGSENMREALQETMDLIKTPVGLEEENLKGDEDVKKKYLVKWNMWKYNIFKVYTEKGIRNNSEINIINIIPVGKWLTCSLITM